MTDADKGPFRSYAEAGLVREGLPALKIPRTMIVSRGSSWYIVTRRDTAAFDALMDAAKEAGRATGTAAASWVTDGNTDPEHVRRMVAMLDEGDPEAEQYLPTRPNLSGEFADDPTPRSIVRDLGCDPDAMRPGDLEYLADAWEDGVAETFDAACESNLREAL